MSYLIETDQPDALVERYSERRSELVDWLKGTIHDLPAEMDADDVGRVVKQLQISGNLHEDIHLATRFLMGEVARRVRRQTEFGHVEDTLAGLCEQFGLGNTETLRRCIRTAETFHGNAQLFGRWLLSGEKKRWKNFVRAGQAEVDPTALGPDAFDRWLNNELNGIQSAAERAEQATAAIDPDDDASIREMEGVVTMLTEEAERLRKKAREVWERDGPTDEALEAYLDWLGEMPCLACGVMGETERHHVAPSVTAKKQSDWLRCPLCHYHHMLIHGPGGGYAKFKEETGYDIRELVARTLHLFVAGEDARFPPGLD